MLAAGRLESTAEEQTSIKDEMSECGDNAELYTQARSRIEECVQQLTQSATFDPRQSAEELYQIRQGYARLLRELEESRRELIKPTSERLMSLILEANKLHMTVKTTSDAALDSRLLAGSAELGLEKVRKLPVGTLALESAEFIRIVGSALAKKRSAHTAGDDEQGAGWKAVGRLVEQRWLGVTTMDHLLGPIAVQPKIRTSKPRVPRTHDAPTPVVQPLTGQSLLAQQAGQEQETLESVLIVYEALQEHSPMPLYQFITDPRSFSRSVENLFYVSFIINNNSATITIDSSGEIIIGLNEMSADEVEEAPKHQQVLNLTLEMWRECIERFQIARPIIE